MSALAGQADTFLSDAHAALAQRRLAPACDAYTKAQALGADPEQCCAGRWLAFMLGGDFAAAWRESDHILARGRPDPHRFWNGQRLDGKHVIVRSLHGLGDAVQMLRYAPQLSALAASVVYEVAPHLLPLAAWFTGVDKVMTWSDPQPVWDMQIELTEMPYIFRTEQAQLPIATNYLQLPEHVIAGATGLGDRAGKPRIGLVWAAGEWNLGRSLALKVFESLLSDQRFEVWSLQGGAAADVRNPGLRRSDRIERGGLLSLAATIADLDLVITVDTLTAHLAGALGKSAWVLLEHAADWRWMIERDDSPWYPTLRLFRQQEQGKWPAVVEAVQQALEKEYR